MEQEIIEQYQRWMKRAVLDKDLKKELIEMADEDEKIRDAFYKNLTFGTGGLRGILGAGTDRMNIYTVAKASQGLADYLIQNFESPSVVIGYDSRIKSDLFAQTAAGVFSANGIKVYVWPELMPAPMVSFAVRYLGASAGVMVTASHNPAKYNGYKVYGGDGCQITSKAAKEIQAEIEKLDIFEDVKMSDFNLGDEHSIPAVISAGINDDQKKDLQDGSIEYISEEVYTAFVEAVKKQSVLGDVKVDKHIAIVYSPLHGTGLKPVLRTLKECGYINITVVKEQEQPDGNFTTCPYPNPEIKEAMTLGMDYARACHADLLIATDPDCDRVGIAVKNRDGDYVLLSGNQTGLLLMDYICSRRIAMGTMPKHPVMMKTIVTTDMAEQIAAHYGVQAINVLTGFKYIGEQIGLLEKAGEDKRYIFGMEESYGYLTGTYARDKDGVGAALMICEMFTYYAAQGIRLSDKLEELYQTYGYCLNTLHSYEFEGAAGFDKMQNIMAQLRQGQETIGPQKVKNVLDYSKGLDGLPKSDVLKYLLEDHCSVVIRPSGTEPKLKCYISVSGETKAEAEMLEKQFISSLQTILEI